MKPFFISLLVISLMPKPGEIRWNIGRQLLYDDFKAPVPASSPWAATTNSSIFFAYQESGKLLRNITVYSSFDPELSWMKTKSSDVLRHEQLHFDITEYFARKFYAEAVKLLGTAHTGSQLKGLFEKTNSECSQTQNAYDEESEHGVNMQMQEKWEKKVSAWLKALPAYPATE